MELNNSTTRTISWKSQDERNTLCIWRIKGDEGDIVSLKIEELQLEMESDFLRVLDGTDCGAEVIYFFRGNSTFQPQSIYSTSNAMVIVLAVPIAKYDHINSSYSFPRITVQSSESATILEDEPTSDRALNIAGICGQEVIIHIPRELSWKRKYRADSLCTWSIRSIPGQQLALSMVDFNLGTESYLQILEGNNQNMKLIAQYSLSMYEWLPTIYAPSGRMVMVINSPAKSAGGYFRAHLSSVDFNMSTEQGYTGNGGKIIFLIFGAIKNSVFQLAGAC
ncbi:unnamed protein product [Dicrocoelium dendriticum]|nr:unnamed protein product [Dicrocoelium dendriticum]